MTNDECLMIYRPFSAIERWCRVSAFREFGMAVTVGVVLVGLLLAAPLQRGWAGEDKSKETSADAGQSKSSGETIDPLSVNAGCYLCHIPFVTEEISKVHFAEKITCIKCHGLSAAHANDENVGATKPDIFFRRDQVDKMCLECHDTHDTPARAVIARFAERNLNDTAAVCTDCHGHHRIEKPAEDEEDGGTPATATNW